MIYSDGNSKYLDSEFPTLHHCSFVSNNPVNVLYAEKIFIYSNTQNIRASLLCFWMFGTKIFRRDIAPLIYCTQPIKNRPCYGMLNAGNFEHAPDIHYFNFAPSQCSCFGLNRRTHFCHRLFQESLSHQKKEQWHSCHSWAWWVPKVDDWFDSEIKLTFGLFGWSSGSWSLK